MNDLRDGGRASTAAAEKSRSFDSAVTWNDLPQELHEAIVGHAKAQSFVSDRASFQSLMQTNKYLQKACSGLIHGLDASDISDIANFPQKAKLLRLDLTKMPPEKVVLAPFPAATTKRRPDEDNDKDKDKASSLLTHVRSLAFPSGQMDGGFVYTSTNFI
mgnify:CR=1 FL=1